MATAPLTDSGLRKKITDIDRAHQLGEMAAGSIPDGGGLCLKRLPSGKWVWWARYRFHSKANVLSLGVYPDVTLGQARSKHKEAKDLLDQGIDPAAHRDERRAVAKVEAINTFETLGMTWWDNWRKGNNINDKHAQRTLRILEKDVFPKIGRMPVHAITLRHVSPIILSISERSPSFAEKAFGWCGQIFRHAHALGMIDHSPLASIRLGDLLHNRPAEEHQKRVTAQQIPDLLRAIDSYHGVLARLGLQLMALVFLRHAELRGAQWDEFDFETNLWTIPAARMKMPTDHIIPLSRQALTVIEQLRAINGGRVHLFPSVKGEGKVMSDGTMNKALHALGYKDIHTVHGFRGMASTALHEMDYPHEHIELQLAHMERNKVSAAYNFASYIPQRTKMMQRWADFLDEQRNKGQIIKIA